MRKLTPCLTAIYGDGNSSRTCLLSTALYRLIGELTGGKHRLIRN
uniref:Uncharacterized protein n=1 Tax=Myoviridae sp. ctPJU6 TaxID=2827684 RepID=A0A8S5TJ44_9CAUD|nr:MAG TPA: hypothetical protein [Myoviridae sp. ctPJU6]